MELPDNIKTWLKNLSRPLWSKELDDLDNYRASHDMCEAKVEQNAELLGKNKDLKDEIVSLKKKMNPIPMDIEDLAENIRFKYPVANISYKGYNAPLKNGPKLLDINVCDFVQVMNSHKIWCKQNKFRLSYYLKKYSEFSYGEVINKLMFDIYDKYVSRKSYMYDNDLYGKNEHWAPTLETWYLKRMDCENSSNELLCLFEAAGLNDVLKSFSWNVCGKCKLGGHSTIYAYDFKYKKWRHLETTVYSNKYKNFHEFPFNDDSNDSLNIYSVWFSFNSDIARHTFKTDSDGEKFNNRDKFKEIKIEEINND